jgi:hypothetical protein
MDFSNSKYSNRVAKGQNWQNTRLVIGPIGISNGSFGDARCSHQNFKKNHFRWGIEIKKNNESFPRRYDLIKSNQTRNIK